MLVRALSLVAGFFAARGLYRQLVGGGLTIDTGIGREVRRLGPQEVSIAAPRETVFAVVAAPYLGRTPKALESKLKVIERGSDLVLAEHYTPVRDSVAVTVETVRFEEPSTVHFRLLRGPVPHVVERFDLAESEDGTTLLYTGELGTDFWGLGRVWGGLVARRWEAAVAESLAAIKAEAERRAG